MNLTAIFPGFLLGAQTRHARPRPQTADVPLPERRTMVRHEIMTLEDRRLQLHVRRGWVWVTRDGCPADLVLGAGDVFEQLPGARVLVQALEEAELLIAGAGTDAHNA